MDLSHKIIKAFEHAILSQMGDVCGEADLRRGLAAGHPPRDPQKAEEEAGDHHADVQCSRAVCQGCGGGGQTQSLY